MLEHDKLLRTAIIEAEQGLEAAAEMGQNGDSMEDWDLYDALVADIQNMATENNERLAVSQRFVRACPTEAISEAYNNANLTFQELGILLDDEGKVLPEADQCCEYWELAATTARDYLDVNNLPIPELPVTRGVTPPSAPNPNSPRIHLIYNGDGDLAQVTTDAKVAEMASSAVMDAGAAQLLSELPPRRAMEVMSGSTWDEISQDLQGVADSVEDTLHQWPEDHQGVSFMTPTPLDTPRECLDERMNTLQSIYDPHYDLPAWIELQELLFSAYENRPVNLNRLLPGPAPWSFHTLGEQSEDDLHQLMDAIIDRREEVRFDSQFQRNANTFRSEALSRLEEKEVEYALTQKQEIPSPSAANQTDNLHTAIQQRDVLAKSISEGAQAAGMIEPGTELSGPQLLMAVNDMSMAAAETVARNQAKANAGTPDFDAVRNKRLSELSPEHEKVARELWLRENIGHMPDDQAQHIGFLLDRLDEARAGQAPDIQGTSNDTALNAAQNTAREMEAMEREYLNDADDEPEGPRLG